MLYIKLVIFITQHQEVENHFQHNHFQSIGKSPAVQGHTNGNTLILSGTTDFAQVQMDKTGSCHFFTLLFLWLKIHVLFYWDLLIPIFKHQVVHSQAYFTITQKS